VTARRTAKWRVLRNRLVLIQRHVVGRGPRPPDDESDLDRWGRLWTQAQKLAAVQKRNDLAIVFAQLVEAELLEKLAKSLDN